MKKSLIALTLIASLAMAQEATKKHDAKKDHGKPEMKSATTKHEYKSAGSLQWGPAPPGLPAGGQLTVLQGDPGKPGHFIIRLKAPAGYKIAPHWHPSAEHVTLVSGDFLVGGGDKMDEAAAQKMAPGDFVTLPAKHRHYAIARTESVIQISSSGPFQITYVNAADDPRGKK